MTSRSVRGSRLECRGIGVTYGAHRAVRAVDLVVGAGELVGLIGANGAGKTSVIDAIAGFVDHSGSVVVDGIDVSALAPYRRARAGVARTFQDGRLFGDLSVGDNCRVAAERSRSPAGPGGTDGEGASAADAARLALDRVGLAGLEAASPSELTGGQRSLVGVARAIAASPRLLLLDEPAAGLDSSETAHLGETLSDLVVGSSVGGLLVEHDVSLVFDICPLVYVMDAGEIVASGTPQEVAADPAVMKAYLGVTVTP